MRLIFANLWCLNPCLGKAIDALKQHDADLVAFAELAPSKLDSVAARLLSHPHLCAPFTSGMAARRDAQIECLATTAAEAERPLNRGASRKQFSISRNETAAADDEASKPLQRRGDQ